MSQQKLLRHVVQTLDGSGIQYMLTGSVVSSLQGEPRSTHDIDIIVAIEPASAIDLVEAFPSADYYYMSLRGGLEDRCGKLLWRTRRLLHCVRKDTCSMSFRA